MKTKLELVTEGRINQKLPFLSRLFARFLGRLHWVCPICNSLHETRLKAVYEPLHCNNCQIDLQHGLILYQTPRGMQEPPKDTLFIAGGFVNRRTVNRVYCDNCSKELLKPIDFFKKG